ncbi:DUF3368 domain-containing protein [Planctomycetales bacterium]|nr:DUF3368 domain-containing protein [Planctomycetales bacterium]
MHFPKIIISDASCLVNLERIQAIPILEKVCGSVIITEEVALEFGKPIPDWIDIHKASVYTTQELQEAGLDLGESSSISLALELRDDCLLILDDLAARVVAAQQNLKFTGLLGILLRAKERGIIKEIKLYVEQLKKAGFRLSDKVIQDVLREAGEK